MRRVWSSAVRWIKGIVARRTAREFMRMRIAEERTQTKHPAEIVMRYLMTGREMVVGGLVFKLDGHARVMVKSKDPTRMELVPGQVRVVEHEPWIKCDMRIDQFLSMCLKIPRDELFAFGASASKDSPG